MKKNLVLIGMPAVGKSTIGVILAKELGYDFIDTDLLIQNQEKRLLKEIIKDEGIDGFLEIENQVNRDLDVVRSIIAPGGSVVYCEGAMQHFKEIGTIIYLHVSYAEIERRIEDAKNRGVVLRKGQELKDLYEERKILFERYADITISEDGKSIEDTISETLAMVRNLTEI